MNGKNKKNNIIIPTFLSKELVDQIFIEKLLAIEERKYLKLELIKENNGEGGNSSIPSFDYFLKKVSSKASKKQEKTDGSEIIKDLEDSLEKVKDNIFSGNKNLERPIDQRIEDRLTSIGETISGSKKDINILINFIIHAERLVSFFALRNSRKYPDEYSGGYVATNLSKQINLEVTNLANKNNKDDNTFLFSFAYYINHNPNGIKVALTPAADSYSEFVGDIRECYKGGDREKDVNTLEEIFFNENDANIFKRYLEEFENDEIMLGSIPKLEEFTKKGVNASENEEKNKTPYKIERTKNGRLGYRSDTPEIKKLNSNIGDLLKLEI